MKTMLLSAALGIFSVIAITATARAEYPSYSEWDSTYGTAQGAYVRARVILHGEAGSYHTQQGNTGWLEGIQVAPSPEYPGVTLLTGTWRFDNGQYGWFKFNFNETWTRLTGIWGFTGSKVSYSWTGHRISGSNPAPVVSRPPVNPVPVQGPPPVARPQITQPSRPSFNIPNPGRASGANQLTPEQFRRIEANRRRSGSFGGRRP